MKAGHSTDAEEGGGRKRGGGGVSLRKRGGVEVGVSHSSQRGARGVAKCRFPVVSNWTAQKSSLSRLTSSTPARDCACWRGAGVCGATGAGVVESSEEEETEEESEGTCCGAGACASWAGPGAVREAGPGRGGAWVRSTTAGVGLVGLGGTPGGCLARGGAWCRLYGHGNAWARTVTTCPSLTTAGPGGVRRAVSGSGRGTRLTGAGS